MTKLEDKYWRKICIQQNEIDKYLNEKFDLQDRIAEAIEYIKEGVDFKSLHFIKGKDEDMWKIILVDGIKEHLLEILGDKENE